MRQNSAVLELLFSEKKTLKSVNDKNREESIPKVKIFDKTNFFSFIN